MDAAGSSAFEVETVPSPPETLDEETRAKLVKLPKLKLSQKEKVQCQLACTRW